MITSQMSDIDYIVDDLLARWHIWKNADRPAQGYRSTDATCRDAQSQWSYHDRDNGTLDAQIERETMKAVDRAVGRVPNHPRQWHTAISIEARNLVAMAEVWNSMRLPTDREELAVLRLEARNMLTIELRREGCIGG